ncbi:MAG: CRISPR-associated protein Csx16 [Methylococcaceae bacterium]|nr:CRISPR-associated protein Csx16 [Methylococcaceae bacterium]
MTIYFITRHPGAIAWAKLQGITVDRQLAHLDINDIQLGDTVIGSLPVNLASEVCSRGANYVHMSLTMPEHWRGMELSVEQMMECDARLENYVINRSCSSV